LPAFLAFDPDFATVPVDADDFSAFSVEAVVVFVVLSPHGSAGVANASTAKAARKRATSFMADSLERMPDLHVEAPARVQLDFA